MKSLSEVYSTLLDYLLPELCPLCMAPSKKGYCDNCRNEFCIVPDPCPTCGLARPVDRCPRKDAIWNIDRVLAPLTYAQPVISQIHALKFASGRNLGRALGLILAGYLESGFDIDVDALIPIPLHTRRFRDRGYNQALEIARPVAASLRLPLRIAGVRRIVATTPLAELDADSRRRNIAGAFSVTRNVDGLRIAVIDDVVTTGATANALAAELLEAGAERVEAWAVARAL
jgi:ComF family protein